MKTKYQVKNLLSYSIRNRGTKQAGVKTLIDIAECAKNRVRRQLAVHGIAAPHATTIARILRLLDI